MRGRKTARRSFRRATGAALVCATVTALTLVYPAWIELVFGVDPDGGSSSLEWAVVAVSLLSTIGSTLRAARLRITLRRCRIVADSH